MHVFVMSATWLSENTLMTEIVGVFAHMHQTIEPVRQLKADGKLVRVARYEVTGMDTGRPRPKAFEVVGPGGTPGVRPVGEGVQTDPSVDADRAASGELS